MLNEQTPATVDLSCHWQTSTSLTEILIRGIQMAS